MPEHSCCRVSRRSFLNAGSLGFLGLTLRDYLSAAENTAGGTGKANSVILLWLEGGPSHIDTWDPKKNSNFRPISTNVAGIQISELLPKMARRMDKFALVRSMHTRGTDHPQATHYAITGHEVNPAIGDRRPRVALTDGSSPADLRPARGKLLEKAGFAPDTVALRTEPLRPIVGAHGSPPQHEQNRETP